uniref:Uncharacterized protein n=1 Tax=Rhizophora mucronata TaxID=61149 RepID=A0A2P2R4S5_RHIMU
MQQRSPLSLKNNSTTKDDALQQLNCQEGRVISP